jgi:hypothetical protein
MYEQRFREGRIRPEHAFLCADDDGLRGVVSRIVERVTRDAQQSAEERGDPAEFDRWIEEQLEPFRQSSA